MFEKLKTINFEELNNIDFQPQKWQKEFSYYLKSMEKILNCYLELEEYEEILNDKDINILKKEIIFFSIILKNIGNKGWKDPKNKKFKKEKFNQIYIDWLNDRIGIYKHNLYLLSGKEEKLKNNIKILKEEQEKKILKKNEELKEFNLDKSELEERVENQKETLQKNTNSIKELKADISDKELNKLALSFWEEEKKYKDGGKGMIYFGFILLLIPTSITIVILVKNINEYILAVPFGLLTLILWYFLYFQLKNYYINRDLETNFANRKAVANSFKGLLEMLNEEENFGDTVDLKSKFFEKVSNILYAEIDTSAIKKHSDNIPISKLLETINELIKKTK
ncbi:MAG: hypothetical protein Q9M94_00365 [Candidatus Gracilibacteria bacterium]|nr:hypothetical protein [Candidatus Gracilibacteria bacterium]